MKSDNDEIRQAVSFQLDDIMFGIDVFKIDRIIKKENLIDLPDQKTHYLVAMIRIQDEIISVISLRKRFGLPEIKLKKEKIIVIKYKNDFIGLLIDDVRKLVEFEELEQIKTKNLYGLPQNFFEGKIKVDGKDIFIFNVFNLLSFEEELNFNKNFNQEEGSEKAPEKKKTVRKKKKETT
ncbi:MAG TPA: hypothetical protein ENN73_05090 [Firmicutes bacterium]|nr:hypothetical protein [Bacillota bacterium]